MRVKLFKASDISLAYSTAILGLVLLFIIGCDKKDWGYKQSPDVYFPKLSLERIRPHLPLAVSESSGIIQIGGNVWTLNDSGNTNHLFEVDPLEGKLIRMVPITNAANFDWEALTQDHRYVYVGDVGNNNGLRAKLRIYRIPKVQFLEANRDRFRADTIEFFYPDFPKNLNPILHNRDCEAMVSFRDSLYFFTKNRGNEHTNVFAVPNQTGKWEARYKGSFDTYGIVTAASTDQSGSSLILLGYRQHPKWRARVPFVYLFWEFPGSQFFEGCAKRWDLKSRRQLEGITWDGPKLNRWLISHEKAGAPGPGLYRLELPLSKLDSTSSIAPHCLPTSDSSLIDTAKISQELSIIDSE